MPRAMTIICICSSSPEGGRLEKQVQRAPQWIPGMQEWV